MGKLYTRWLAAAVGCAALTGAATARAQEPTTPDSGEPAPSSPETPDVAPAAPAPQPAPPPAPPPQPPPTPPAGPPPAYGPYYGPPPGPPEPPPGETTEATTFRPGPYFGASVGYGAPLGAQTLGGDNASIAGGVGVMGALGYQISANFGLGGFIHYNRAKLDYVDSDNEPDENSAWVLFYGLEGRAGFISKVVDGWASIGVAFGTGNLTLREEREDCSFGECISLSSDENYDVTFSAMPTIAFGANAKLSPQWGIGPVFRMYVLSIGEACRDREAEISGPTPQRIEDNECTSDTDEVAIPNVAFAGLELVFRP